MFIDLNNIEPEGVTFDETLDLGSLHASATDPVRVIDCSLRGCALPGERGVELQARLEARLSLSCGRCLEPYQARIGVEFQLILVRRATEDLGPEETEMPAEDVGLFQAEDGRVDLATVVTEQIYLGLPLKPVCRPDCQGLCATCGVNRNHLECDCCGETVDLRLAPLMELKRRLRHP